MYFRKSIIKLASDDVESKKSYEGLATGRPDHSFDKQITIGSIVTVVKDTGCGIENDDELQYFKPSKALPKGRGLRCA